MRCVTSSMKSYFEVFIFMFEFLRSNASILEESFYNSLPIYISVNFTCREFSRYFMFLHNLFQFMFFAPLCPNLRLLQCNRYFRSTNYWVCELVNASSPCILHLFLSYHECVHKYTTFLAVFKIFKHPYT